MITLDLSAPLLNANGTARPGEYLFSTLAEIIALSEGGKNSLKLWGWSQQLYKEKSLTLDDADFEALKNFITDSRAGAVLHKGQLLAAVISSKKT